MALKLSGSMGLAICAVLGTACESTALLINALDLLHASAYMGGQAVSQTSGLAITGRTHIPRLITTLVQLPLMHPLTADSSSVLHD